MLQYNAHAQFPFHIDQLISTGNKQWIPDLSCIISTYYGKSTMLVAGKDCEPAVFGKPGDAHVFDGHLYHKTGPISDAATIKLFIAFEKVVKVNVLDSPNPL